MTRRSTAFSKPARQAVSGYLPFLLVDPPRVELGSPPRQGGVFPLDHEPVLQWTAEESNLDYLGASQASCR